MRFLVRGRFMMAPGIWQKFTKEIEAKDEREAIEKTYSILGSNHRTKRIHIKIEEVVKNGDAG